MGIPGIEACDLVGRQLHITGGRPEWADMDATIQTAEVDLVSGAVTISCGAQGHLSFDDYARLRDLARLRDESGASPKPADPPEEPGSGGDPGTEPETPVTISAMFSPVNTAFSAGGLQIGAFAAYKRSDGIWWTSGGLVCQGGKLALIPPTKVGGTGNEAIMAVPRRLRGGGYQYVLKRAPIGGGSSSSSSSSSPSSSET